MNQKKNKKLINFKERKNWKQCNFPNFPANHCFTHNNIKKELQA